MTDFTQEVRDSLVAKIASLKDDLYPERRGLAPPNEKTKNRLREAYYAALAEYADRLPRIIFGRCPFTGAPFTRVIDPFGLDGPWWHQKCVLKIDEPTAPKAFKTHLGALSLNGRKPIEVGGKVSPGPDSPFVIPRLLRLPGMIAVLRQIDLEIGDRAWVVSYWSRENIPPVRLHQPWLRVDHWFKNERGKSAWTIANDTWDFELEPYLADGRLRWIQPGDSQQRVVSFADKEQCPFVGLPGDRRPQVFSGGARGLAPLPDGSAINPFAD